jgi:hypothetical protein
MRANQSIGATVRRLHGPLEMLLAAYDYAAETQQPVWDCALELEHLFVRGLTAADLRWLGDHGLVEYAVETTPPGGTKRTFRTNGSPQFVPGTCAVLTAAGAGVVRSTSPGGARLRMSGATPSEVRGAAAFQPVPRWDRDRRELLLGGRLVKRFRQRAPVQETILAAFEEEGWPPAVLDPLTPQPGLDPKQRLHSAINALNRAQNSPGVRFRGDGTGQGICWQVRT